MNLYVSKTHENLYFILDFLDDLFKKMAGLCQTSYKIAYDTRDLI